MSNVVRPRTRDALVTAAREVLASDGPTVPVSTITARAGVAVGSFYNHFDSKDVLFQEAARGAMTDFEAYLITRTMHLEDPVEVLCTRIRLYCRMPDTHPQVAQILTKAAPYLLAYPTGYSPHAVRDVQAAVDAGRMNCDDIPLRLVMVIGGAMRLISLQLRNPDIDESELDAFAAIALEIFGVPRNEAWEIATRPLQDVVVRGSQT